MTAVLTGCAPSLKVQTAARPEADLGAYHTFTVLAPPAPLGGAVLPADHPMVANSAANRVLRDAIAGELWDNGYWLDERNADLFIAYYASLDEPLDATQWNYGYGCRLEWWRAWERQPGITETSFPAGTVIIDVLEAGTGKVLWRGFGVAATSGNARQYRDSLRKTVQELLGQMPGHDP
jgi:hypothetical protein